MSSGLRLIGRLLARLAKLAAVVLAVMNVLLIQPHWHSVRPC